MRCCDVVYESSFAIVSLENLYLVALDDTGFCEMADYIDSREELIEKLSPPPSGGNGSKQVGESALSFAELLPGFCGCFHFLVNSVYILTRSHSLCTETGTS